MHAAQEDEEYFLIWLLQQAPLNKMCTCIFPVELNPPHQQTNRSAGC